MGQRKDQVLDHPFLLGFLTSSDIYWGRHCGFKCYHHGSGAQRVHGLEEDKQRRGHCLTSYETLGQSISPSGSVSLGRAWMDEISGSQPPPSSRITVEL